MTAVSFDIDVVREAYPIVRDLAYFNTGTYGIMAEPMLERYLESVARFERRGMAGRDGLQEEIERARQRIAARINASATEIALTGNATDGIAYVAAGLELSPGDEVIISDQEHPAMRYPWEYIAQRRGLVVRRYTVAHDPERSLESLRSLLTPRTRLIGTSHVTSPNGIRLPVGRICSLAHEHGVLALVDGAQSFAVMPIDVGIIGCDFFTGNGHKWLGGPKGTGFFYARQELMELLQPAYVGAGSLREPVGDQVALEPSGRRFEFGTRGFATPAGLNVALDWLDRLGWDDVSGVIERLSGHLKRQLAETPGVRLCTPMEWERSSGLVTFQVPGHDETDLQARLEERGLFPRTLGRGSERIRVSCALFNTEDEIERLVDCVRGFLG
jgi:selenocysteine lyase/cysteine desulfurase